jgi:hypothetical protein
LDSFPAAAEPMTNSSLEPETGIAGMQSRRPLYADTSRMAVSWSVASAINLTIPDRYLIVSIDDSSATDVTENTRAHCCA